MSILSKLNLFFNLQRQSLYISSILTIYSEILRDVDYSAKALVENFMFSASEMSAEVNWRC